MGFVATVDEGNGTTTVMLGDQIVSILKAKNMKETLGRIREQSGGDYLE